METIPVVAEAPKKTVWIALGVLVLLLLVLAAGAYAFKDLLPGMSPEEQAVSEIEVQGESTAPEAIEADLTATTPDEFDQEFDTAFAELDASLAE